MAVLTGCPGCGRQYEDHPRFCGSCGAQLSDGPVEEPTEPSLPAAVGEPTDEIGLAHRNGQREDSLATTALPVGRLWSPGDPLPEARHAAALPIAAVPAPRQTASPPQPPKRSDRGLMIALGGAACLIVIVLGAALYVGGVFNGSGTSNAPSTTPVSQRVAAPPTSGSTTAPTAPVATSPATTPTTPAPAPQPPPGPAEVIRTHLQDLGSGNYTGAFALMTPAYRSQNPSWPSERSAADPGINVISIGTPQYGSGSAEVPVDFFARDSNPTSGSDTQCREFQGTAHLVKQGGSWRYDPAGDKLSATVSNGNSNCPS